MAKKKTTKKKTVKKKATTKKKSASSKRGKKDMLIVASKSKEALKGKNLNVASDTLEALNEYVHWLVDQAQKKCLANGRKTVRPHDIIVF